MNKKIYKCGVIVYSFPDSYISAGDEIKGLVIDIWNVIKKKLIKKKFNIKEILINKENQDIIHWGEYIKKIKNKEYDIIIAPFWIRLERLKEVDFTYPLYSKKQVIIYSIPENPDINYYNYFLNLVKLWFLPFIIFFFISILLGIFLHNFNKMSLKKNIYHSISGFFGQTSGLIFDNDNNNKIHIYRLMILFIILLFNLYISSTSVTESVEYLKESNILETSIKGVKIAVNGSHQALIIKKKGGIPVRVYGNTYDYYMKHRFNKNISGFLNGSLTTGRLINNHRNLKVSKLLLGNELCSFPINKENTDLKKSIDEILIEIKSSGIIKNICNEYTVKNGNTIC